MAPSGPSAGTLHVEGIQKDRTAGLDAVRSADRESDAAGSRQPERSSGPDMEEARTPKSVDRDLGL